MRSFMTFEPPAAEPAPAVELAAGQDLAALLAHGAESHGLTLHEPVDEHDSCGWFFVAGTREQRVWCMLQRSDQWLVITKLEVPLFKRLVGRQGDQAAHRRVCEALHSAALSIPGVSGIRWFTAEEFQHQRPGAVAP